MTATTFCDQVFEDKMLQIKHYLAQELLTTKANFLAK